MKRARLIPFCHLPGTACMIPWSPWKVEVFPEFLKFQHMVNGQRYEERLDWKGPVLDLTTQLDLEKGVLSVFGHTVEGYRHMEVRGKDPMARRPLERLSLGSHKKLDWELVSRRKEMQEILPIWHHLGQMVPKVQAQKVGSASLLKPYDKMVVEKELLKLFLVGFEKMMVPRLCDTDHQGIIEPGEFSSSPLILLTEGAELIRSLLFQETASGFSFLPRLAPSWHAGSFSNLQTAAGDRIDFIWSKKLLREVVIYPGASRNVIFTLQKLTSFRLNRKERLRSDQPLELHKGQKIYLDRFE